MDNINADKFLELLNSGIEKVENYVVNGELNLGLIIQATTFQLTINKVDFINDVKAENSNFGNKLIFTNCTFHSKFKIEKSYFFSLDFKESLFRQPFLLLSSKFITCSIQNATFNAAANIEDVTADHISLFDLGKQNILIANPHFTEMMVFSLKEKGEIFIGPEGYKPKYELDPFIKILKIGCGDNFNYSIVIKKITILVLKIDGFNESGKILLSDISAENVIIENFVNNGYVVANNISSKSNSQMLAVQNSNLGRFEIYNINFEQFDTVNIIDSYIADVVSSNIKWCKSNALTKVSGNDHLNSRESFRQLKNIMIKTNNKPDELRFFGYEMRAYHNELKKSKGRRDEKFILWTNYYSNQYGLSWMLPLIELLLINLLLYTVIKINLHQTHFNPNLIINDVVGYLEFMNPIHKTSEVFFENKSAIAELFDIVDRLIGGFLLFQFLRAFRRLVRK